MWESNLCWILLDYLYTVFDCALVSFTAYSNGEKVRKRWKVSELLGLQREERGGQSPREREPGGFSHWFKGTGKTGLSSWRDQSHLGFRMRRQQQLDRMQAAKSDILMTYVPILPNSSAAGQS